MCGEGNGLIDTMPANPIFFNIIALTLWGLVPTPHIRDVSKPPSNTYGRYCNAHFKDEETEIQKKKLRNLPKDWEPRVSDYRDHGYRPWTIRLPSSGGESESKEGCLQGCSYTSTIGGQRAVFANCHLCLLSFWSFTKHADFIFKQMVASPSQIRPQKNFRLIDQQPIILAQCQLWCSFCLHFRLNILWNCIYFHHHYI